MKRVILMTAVLLFSASTLVSCRNDTQKETVIIREVEKPQEVKEKGLLERTGEKVDKRVNQEIDEEIDNIVNDNN